MLYRLAEMMEARTSDLAAVCSGKKEVAAAVDRVVWYAGWADKLAQVVGASNPVAGPYFNFTVPEPTGVVAILAPDEPALGGLVSRVAPALVGGNAVVVLASETQPLAAIELAEAIATSDVPGGVVNVLTGSREEIAPILAGHMDVNALDVTGADGLTPELERLAADNVKRVVHGTRRRAEPVGDHELPRAEDGLAPGRPVTASTGRGLGRGSRRYGTVATSRDCVSDPWRRSPSAACRSAAARRARRSRPGGRATT